MPYTFWGGAIKLDFIKAKEMIIQTQITHKITPLWLKLMSFCLDFQNQWTSVFDIFVKLTKLCLKQNLPNSWVLFCLCFIKLWDLKNFWELPNLCTHCYYFSTLPTNWVNVLSTWIYFFIIFYFNYSSAMR